MNNVKGFEQLDATALGSAVALTVPAGTERALLQAETANVRYRVDGNDPTTAVGMLVIAGTLPLEITTAGGLLAAKFIGASGSPLLNVTYYG
jgi:hypothetical protein